MQNDNYYFISELLEKNDMLNSIENYKNHLATESQDLLNNWFNLESKSNGLFGEFKKLNLIDLKDFPDQNLINSNSNFVYSSTKLIKNGIKYINSENRTNNKRTDNIVNIENNETSEIIFCKIISFYRINNVDYFYYKKLHKHNTNFILYNINIPKLDGLKNSFEQYISNIFFKLTETDSCFYELCEKIKNKILLIPCDLE